MPLKKISDHFRFLILKTGNFSSLNKIYLLFYKIALIFIVRSLNKLREVKAICLEGSLAQDKAELKAGSTDIDLIIITGELSIENELKFIYAYIKKCMKLKRIFPFLKDYSALNKAAAHIHSYSKILGPYHFKRYGRLYKVIRGDCASGYSPNKSDFGLESYRAEDFFILFRTSLRPINEEVFNAATDNRTYIRNSITSIKRIIDYITVNIPEFKDEPIINILNKKIEIISNKNLFIHPNDFQFFIATIDDFYKLSEKCLVHLLPHAQYQGMPSDKKLFMTKNSFPNETLKNVVGEIEGRIKNVYKDTQNAIYNISILPDYTCNYTYIPYVFLKDNLDPQAIKSIYEVLKKINISETGSSAYYSNPVLLTKNIFDINRKYVESYCAPLDILLFNRLIYSIAGNSLSWDLGKEATQEFINAKLYGDISKVEYNYLIDSHNTFEQLIECLQNKNLSEVKKATDYLLGSMARHRLAIEKGIITSTTLEAFTEYMTHYSSESSSKWYESFYHQFYGSKTNFSLSLIESQIEDLFCFYSKNRGIINGIVNSSLENKLAYIQSESPIIKNQFDSPENNSLGTCEEKLLPINRICAKTPQ
jgi:predicted nucleotidyltransferase